MWALYGVLFLFVTVFQTVTFGRLRVFGVKLSLIPVALACIAMHVGGERGAIFGLAAGTVLVLWPGRQGGALHIVLLCARRRGSGLCVRPVPAAEPALGAADEPGDCLIWSVRACCSLAQVFLGHVALTARGCCPALRQVGLSLLAAPPVYLAAWGIRKAGA